jgi:hypothetical protein
MSNGPLPSPRYIHPPRRLISRMKRTYACICLSALFVFFAVPAKRSMYGAPEDVIQKDQIDRPRHSPVPPASPASSSSSLESSDSNNSNDESKPTQTPSIVTFPPSPPPSAAPTTPTKNGLSTTHTKGLSSSSTTGVLRHPPIVPSASSSYNMTQTEQEFVQTWCDLNQNKVEWYPSGVNAWQQRAPYVIIPGEKHCGTSVLYQALLDHSSFVPAAKSEEMGFFLPRNFKRYVSPAAAGSASSIALSVSSSSSTTTTATTSPPQITKVFAARQRMYAQNYRTTLLKQPAPPRGQQEEEDETTTTTTEKLSIDSTSGYLFYSSAHVPEHIMCVAPWNKLIVVLRDPVDRVYSQWAHGKSYLRLQQSFEDWMAPELSLMQSVGLVQGGGSGGEGTDTSSSSSSLTEGQEDEAWTKYQKAASVPSNLGSAAQGGIGRSMYVIFLRHWIRAYKKSGKTIKQSIYLVRAEDLADNFQVELDKILKFLNVSSSSSSQQQQHSHNHNQNRHDVNAVFGQKMQSALSLQEIIAPTTAGIRQRPLRRQQTKNRNQQEAMTIPPMKKETRQMLKNFFAPYNDQLYDLIHTEFGKSVWKDNIW